MGDSVLGWPVPVWRSLLYVPAHVERFVERAHQRGADCLLLDLEDSVPPAEKARARNGVKAAASRMRLGGADVLVRINAPLELAVPDVQAAIGPAVDGLVVTKTRGPEHVALLDELVGACELACGVPVGRSRFYLLVEAPAALPMAEAMARASPRVVAMSLGAEDFALAIGAEPTEAALAVPKALLLHAARAAGVMPLGLTGTLADFTDIEGFTAMAARSRALGFEGASCINPAQVAPLNAAFSPRADEVVFAERIIEASRVAAKQGLGAVALDGRMIDAPIVRRAEKLLAKASAIAERRRNRGGP